MRSRRSMLSYSLSEFEFPKSQPLTCKCSRHCSSRSFLEDMCLWLQYRRRAARRVSRKVTLKTRLTVCAAGSKPVSKLPFGGGDLKVLTSLQRQKQSCRHVAVAAAPLTGWIADHQNCSDSSRSSKSARMFVLRSHGAGRHFRT